MTGKVATATVGPALIGAGLELWIRRPPATPGEREWPVVGTWRDFPVVGYVAMMVIGFVLSFDHLRALAELVGVPSPASWLLPIGIDLAAISVTLDHAQSKKALERLRASELETAEANRVDAERAEAERVEADRLARVEADRRAAAEAEAQADRARLEAERAEAERRESEARRERLDALSAATKGNGAEVVGPGDGHAVSEPTPRASKASKQDLARDWLAEFGADASNGEVIAGLGWAGTAGDRKAIQRARAALKPAAPESDEPTPSSGDRVEVSS